VGACYEGSLLLVKGGGAAGFEGGGRGGQGGRGLSEREGGGGVVRLRGAVRWVCCQGTRCKPSRLNRKRSTTVINTIETMKMNHTP
jgi:hypothetical protein